METRNTTSVSSLSCRRHGFRSPPIPLSTSWAFTTARVTYIDDWVDGYFLPKGTTIILNVWGLHHDEDHFPDPEQFIPERYANTPLLAPEYAASAEYEKRGHYRYGAGRRICPGIHLAERNLFPGVAKLLWAFSFLSTLDFEGNPVPLDVDSATAYSNGFLHYPKPFNCRIEPRSEGRRNTISREFEDVDENVFSKYD